MLQHKGKKCTRGQGVLYDERKQALKLSVTPTAIAWLEGIALAEQCSMSEAVERAARKSLVTLELVSRLS